MIELTLEMAEKAVKAAHEAAKKINKPIGVTVVDESGRVVLSSRGDGAGFYIFDFHAGDAAVVAQHFIQRVVPHNGGLTCGGAFF